jgi:magnesium-transporting ATPase (P-type)
MFEKDHFIKILIITEIASFLVSFLVIYFLSGKDLKYTVIFTIILNIILGAINYSSLKTAFNKDLK